MPRLFPLLLSLICVSACKKSGQMVLGFATDLSAPNVIDHVTMNVYDPKGTVLLTHDWDLPGMRGRDFKLPGSFTLYADAGAEPSVRVELLGTLQGTTMVSRTAQFQFASGQTLFFRMALVQRCMGMICPDGQSCIEGKCKSEVINTAAFKPYETGRENNVECNSGSALIDTSTQAPMPTDGSGFCAVDEWCGEATCYRDEGQGLVWCNPPETTCSAVEGYESCILGACGDVFAACYGPDWLRAKFTGPCADEGRCRAACHCDPACAQKCIAARSPTCAACASGIDACKANADSMCADPTCQPLPGAPPDMSSPGLSEPFVMAGTYTIGCSATDSLCAADAQPAHQVQVGGYYISRSEITQAQYDACVHSATPCNMPSDTTTYSPSTTPNLPVVGVSWADAFAYCALTGLHLNVSGRLPSEAEWEIAAHGVAGATTPGTLYPWGDTVPTDCSYAECSLCGADAPTDVGTHMMGTSPFGLYDLAGNVAEWTGDWYDAMQYTTDSQSVVMNPMGGNGTSGLKVIRGGSFASDATGIRSTVRASADPTTFNLSTGFRCVFIP